MEIVLFYFRYSVMYIRVYLNCLYHWVNVPLWQHTRYIDVGRCDRTGVTRAVTVGDTVPLEEAAETDSEPMASRGRRGGAPARDDKQRREEQAEQQAPAPQGPVLPPPSPVDYVVFMQCLVQAMQTQAHTQAALQAQLEDQERADVWWSSLLRTRFEDGAVDVAWDAFVRLF
ncbi:hypothetical protein Taro_052406 [Colocasia esculenta]|uniref:Uncharacterized protein n=1 Tax=Colocasia esculenta TaxID=4460 RepID=A0A843XII4_COLES|nr:hypothetical protein [Colocasia esculenta]